jgi:ABC-type multidrug transport system fused ATPase/permease subunit
MANLAIFLLDEATSALDAESENLVQEAIGRATVGRAVVVIAHRLSTVVHTGKITVINNQTIVGTGTHDKLLVRCATCGDLVKR